MKNFMLITEFFGGLILFFGIGCLIGHFLKLDKYLEEDQKERNSTLSPLKQKSKK